MAKIIYVHSRSRALTRAEESRVRRACELLEPDNLTLPAPCRVTVDGALAFGIFNNRSVTVIGNSVLLGCVCGDDLEWNRPHHYPDGSYAIFRDQQSHFEAISDASGSRTIWYYFDDEFFITSTSQRALILFLGSFRFDQRVIPWMLSTGSLGAEWSWDKRIRRLPPDASVVLDKARWEIECRCRPIDFQPVERTHAQHRALLESEVRRAVQSMLAHGQVSFDEYALPLSGGYDSRGILSLLCEKEAPPGLITITWGLEKSVSKAGNDAAIARELASRMGVKHAYFHTDVGNEPAEKIIDRFVSCGEGRVDHLSGYMDGMEIWRRLVEEEGVHGIIRGDEGFGWIPVSSERTVRLSVGIALCSDYRNLENLAVRFGFADQDLPVALQRQENESLNAWRDRLYHAYRMPTILASLSDIKSSYVETVNPLLARSILECVRTLPDHLRTGKALFKEIVNGVGPRIPYASEGANASPSKVLKNRDVARLLRTKLQSDTARRVFSREFLDHITAGIRVRDSEDQRARDKWRVKVRALIPQWVKNWVRDRGVKPVLDANVLAFRVFLIVRMNEILHADSLAFASLADDAPAPGGSMPPAPATESLHARTQVP